MPIVTVYCSKNRGSSTFTTNLWHSRTPPCSLRCVSARIARSGRTNNPDGPIKPNRTSKYVTKLQNMSRKLKQVDGCQFSITWMC